MTTIILTKREPRTLAHVAAAKVPSYATNDEHGSRIPCDGRFFYFDQLDWVDEHRKVTDTQKLVFRHAHQHIWHTLHIDASAAQIAKHHRLMADGYESILKTGTRATNYEFDCATCAH